MRWESIRSRRDGNPGRLRPLPQVVKKTLRYGSDIEMFVVYDESINREVKTRPLYECRCDERPKPKVEESTRLVYTGWLGELEHLKKETRLIDEKFVSVMGKCVI